MWRSLHRRETIENECGKKCDQEQLSQHGVLNEFFSAALKDAGYGGIEVQKTPVGARITVYVTRPGLAIGRKGVGIKDLMTKIEQKFGLQNPQISVLEVPNPES